MENPSPQIIGIDADNYSDKGMWTKTKEASGPRATKSELKSVVQGG